MKVEIIKKTYAFGSHYEPGDKKTFTKKQGQKLIDRNLAKELKPKKITKELKLDKETKDASNKD